MQMRKFQTHKTHQIVKWKQPGIKSLVKEYKRHASDAGDGYTKMQASGSRGQEQLEVAEGPNWEGA